MPNALKPIEWMRSKMGRVTYSMTYRTGPNSYDCSSAVYSALQYAGIAPAGAMGNTETMFNDLPRYGYKNVTGDTPRAGDIVIWGRKGFSSGVNGHTGIFVNSTDFIHCNYGYNTVTINNHNQFLGWNGNPPTTLYRYKDSDASQTYARPEFAAEWSDGAPHWVVRRGDTLRKIADYYGIPGKVQEIAKYNRIANPNLISVGQKIFIPKPLVWTVTQDEINNGLTLEKIDKYYGYTPGTVKILNPGVPFRHNSTFIIWS